MVSYETVGSVGTGPIGCKGGGGGSLQGRVE